MSQNQPWKNQLEDEELIFEEDEELLLNQKHKIVNNREKWKIILVDDEEKVHQVTKFALDNFTFENKSLIILSAYSGEEAKTIINNNPDTALILLDVVMETTDSGLKVVKYIREELKNQSVRIILRTGQPGEAPEESVILEYDINDYKTKLELTQQKLFTTIIAGLRSYRDVIAVEKSHQELGKLYQKLQQFNYSLEEIVKIRTRELEVKNRRLEKEIRERQKAEKELRKAIFAADKANQAKTEFLASMSHELRTPLNAILGFTQIMSRDSSLSLDRQETLNIINRSGEHLLTLINDILEMSKIEAGRSTLTSSSFDLYCFLKNLEDMFSLKAKTKGLNLIVKLDKNVPQYIKTDRGKLRQILINLVGNGLKFTEKGEITLQVKAKLNRELYQLYFEVEDTGPGIAPEEINKLFKVFSQTETGRKSQQGTGLGLAISQKFVQLMGGKIEVNSIVGKGTKFSFNIQVNRGCANEIKKIKPKPRVIGIDSNQPQYRILVVDDCQESRLLLSKLLTSIGFEIREASNGLEAIQEWENWNPQVIFMDIRMPVMDGYQATKKIKSTFKGKKTIIIALTASVFEEERNIILAAGCDDFMLKPFKEELLLEKLIKHLKIRYIYEDKSKKNQQNDKLPLSQEENIRLYFSQMPREWQNQLKEAANECSDDGILELIQVIPDSKSPLAVTLQDLAENFLFHQILELFN